MTDSSPKALPDMTVVENVPLALTPTPIHDLPNASEAAGVRIRVKRDDLTGSHVSGNKIRKLEYLIRQALHVGATHVITCGGIQSNHCRATAFAARQAGMQPVLMLRTPNGALEDLPTPATGNVLLARLAGADIRPCTPTEYGDRVARMDAIAEELCAAGHTPYIIPEGGSNALGALGYVACAHEIADACGDDLPATVLCAVGSGGTAAGLAIGFKHLGLNVRVIGVPVCDDAEYFEKAILAISEEATELYGLTALEAGDVTLLDGFVGRGYALATKEELTVLVEATRRDGLVLDPVYTGKAWGALLKTAETHPETLGGDTMFVHTGGIFGLLSQAEALEAVLG